jgi:hypothetical protein
MSMKKVRLELARDHDFPVGSSERGYEFVAPIDEQGHILADEWKKARERCRVRRFWGHDDDETGHVVRKPGGAWAFHYDIHGDVDDDETGFRFDNHLFKIGEYVSIREHDDVIRTFRVALVLPVFTSGSGGEAENVKDAEHTTP